MRLFGHWLRGARLKLFIGEQAALGVLLLVVLSAAGKGGPWAVAQAMLTVLLLQSALYLADLYEITPELPTSRCLLAAGLGVVLASAGWAVWGSNLPGHWLIAVSMCSCLALLLRELPVGRQARVLVFGSGPTAQRVAQVIQSDSDQQCVLVGFLDDGQRPDSSELAPSSLSLVGEDQRSLAQLCEHSQVDVLVLASERPISREAWLWSKARGIELLSAADFVERQSRRVVPELLRPGELELGEGFGRKRLVDTFQRVLDFVVATVLLILSAPVLLAAMVAVRLDSAGPVFYRQERVGRFGRPFFITKLRTMRIDAEAEGVPRWAAQNDSRVTRVGRFLRLSRIDELPQLFAVLRGDMSMVGPRPERPFFVSQLSEQLPLFRVREWVRPGVTGWAQISYPYGATLQDSKNKLEFDLYFIRRRSIFLNISILFHTARTVLTGRGAR